MSPSTRPPAVAGMFYPASKAALGALVDELLANARPSENADAADKMDTAARPPKALIVPHAGYPYSGPIAASAFVRLVPHAAALRRIVLLGPAHRARVRGLASPGVSRMATPLGEMEVDVAALEAIPQVGPVPNAHALEHSLEVELPFLQRIAPSAKLIPLVVGDATPEQVADVLRAVWDGPSTLVVVSSDLSHYLPYAEGRALDERTADRIAALDPTPLNGDEACGCNGINGLVRVARERGLRTELVDLRSSGDTAGSRDEVVGYGAFAFYEGLS
jgi:MEMO1 family protein